MESEAAGCIAKLLKEIGADINAPGGDKQPTMLDMAAKRGDSELVQILLDCGAVRTSTTLTYAIQSQNMVLIDNLLMGGAETDSLSCDDPPSTPFAEAIQLGDEMLMTALEQKGALKNINETHRFLAALTAASEVGNTEVIQFLLSARTTVDLTEQLGLALRTAIYENHGEVAILLLEAGADLRTARIERRLLSEALKNRNQRLVNSLLNFGLDFYELGVSPLVLAVKWGNISTITDLLVAGYDVNNADGDGPGHQTPLIIAIEQRNRPLVQLLLDAGADVNQGLHPVVYRNVTALSTAIKNHDTDMVDELILRGADVADPMALLESCKAGGEIHCLFLGKFLRRYPEGRGGFCDCTLSTITDHDSLPLLELVKPLFALRFSAHGPHTGNLLFDALRTDNEASSRVVQMLLASGINPNAISGEPGRRFHTLSVAIEAENLEAIKLLLEKGADINFPATRGIRRTPIQSAAELGCFEIVRALLDRGADADAPAAANGGATAIQLAAIGGFIGIVELLIKAGADVNRAPARRDGRTAVEGAAEYGRLDMVHFLLKFGVGVAQNDDQRLPSAMSLAEKNGHMVVLELLRSHLKQLK